VSKENPMRLWMTPGRADRHEQVLAVEAGRVICPRRGSVDIERCWTCPEYRGLTTSRVEGLICGLRPGSLPEPGADVTALDVP
jgi:hypothetical protein